MRSLNKIYKELLLSTAKHIVISMHIAYFGSIPQEDDAFNLDLLITQNEIIEEYKLIRNKVNLSFQEYIKEQHQIEESLHASLTKNEVAVLHYISPFFSLVEKRRKLSLMKMIEPNSSIICLSQIINKTNRILEDLNKKLHNNLYSETIELTDRNLALNSKLDTLLTENTSLKQDINNAQKTIASMNSQIKKAKFEVTSLKNELNETKKYLSKIVSDKSKITQNNATETNMLKDKIKNLTDKIDKLKMSNAYYKELEITRKIQEKSPYSGKAYGSKFKR